MTWTSWELPWWLSLVAMKYYMLIFELKYFTRRQRGVETLEIPEKITTQTERKMTSRWCRCIQADHWARQWRNFLVSLIKCRKLCLYDNAMDITRTLQYVIHVLDSLRFPLPVQNFKGSWVIFPLTGWKSKRLTQSRVIFNYIHLYTWLSQRK